MKTAFLAATLLLLAVAAALVGRAAATFSDEAPVGGNTFTTDTLDPPTNVTASPGATEGTIDLSWTATVDTYASGYRIFRATASGGPYSQIDEVTPRSATSYQDSGRDAGTTYYYVLRSFYQNWESVNSNEASTAAQGVLNLQANDTEMSTATSPAGNIDTNDGQTDYFTATSPVTSASNETDWTLVLVLRDKPNVAAPATVTVWWQNGGACSGGAVPGQIFATGSVTVPIAVDKQGVTLTVPKVGGTVSHTFVSGDLLCMSIRADGSGSDYDLHYYANTASTSGTPGVSRLAGPFTQDDTLDPPTGLTASVVGSDIQLDWTANTTDPYATGYKVYRGTTSGGPYSEIDTVTPVTATTYTDTTVSQGIRYYYVLRTYYGSLESGDSNEANAAVPGDVSLTSVADTYVKEDGGGDDNYGTDAEMKVKSDSGKVKRSLVQFDLSSIPAGVTIDSAMLTICLSADPSAAAQGRIHELRLLTSSWTETGVIWNNQPTVSGTVTDTITVPTAAQCLSFTVTADVQSWVDGTANNGWRLSDQNEGSDSGDVKYRTRENGVTGERPKLQVTYTPP